MVENIALPEVVMEQNALFVKKFIQIEGKKLKHKKHKVNYSYNK